MDTFEGYIGASCICILQGEGTKPPYIFDKPLVALTNNSSGVVVYRWKAMTHGLRVLRLQRPQRLRFLPGG
jgi:hypothetical protein